MEEAGIDRKEVVVEREDKPWLTVNTPWLTENVSTRESNSRLVARTWVLARGHTDGLNTRAREIM